MGNKIEEKFIDKNIAELCKEYSLIFGANLQIGRISPGVIDGLKPVARRLIYTMYLKDQGKKIRKVAAIAGDTIARLHHHGQVSVFDTLVGLAQWWKNNIMLIEGSGNFGTVSGDSAAAERYIYAKLSDFAQDCFFSEWKDSTVDMVMGADEETLEPLYLPAKYPIVLLNGSLGIGFGASTNIPPFNFSEVIEVTRLLMNQPDAPFVLIPDSPTGCDIIMSDFQKMTNSYKASYAMRCKYDIDNEHNKIIIRALPYQVKSNDIVERIADIKENDHGLSELKAMEDLSGKEINLHLYLKDDVNPYKFMKKLIANVAGFEKTYPVNISVVNEFQSCDLSIRDLILAWIQYRREQKRVIIVHRHTALLAEQRTNDVKIFILQKENFNKTLSIFKNSRNKQDIEQNLIKEYHNTEIQMDSLQAKTLSEMRMYQLSKEEYEKCLKRRDELLIEIKDVEDILNTEKGIDKLIIAELRDGVKKFGVPRKSNVVPYKISVDTEVEGSCILQLSSDGMILRKIATNVDEEPVPTDSNGFAVKVDNDSSFILIDDKGHFSFIKARELPVDKEVPVNRFLKQSLGNIVAMLPFDFDSNLCCTLISKDGMLKKMRIRDITPSKRPCMDIQKDDIIIKGIVTKEKSDRDILVYTDNGMGQRLDPNNLRVTSTLAKGNPGFKLFNDSIVGCYSINPKENQYVLYITSKGKARLNEIDYLPTRDSKHDKMVRLINLPDRDHLVSVVGCNRLDKVQVFYQDGESETIDVSKLPIETMGSEPRKVTERNAVSNTIVKAKIV